MALKLLQHSGMQPWGQFDGYDGDYLTTLGGEVGTLRTVGLTDGDKAAKDADGSDGYAGTSSKTRVAVTKTLTSGTRPLFLLDDGTSGYGTLFGSVVGGLAGQLTTGTVLGPHTATGSGKVTCWAGAGLYAVTLNAVDTAADGLVSSNAALSGGDPLYAQSNGLLTPEVSRSFEATLVLGRFIEFSTNGSLVTTPVHLVTALNSPSGAVPVQTAFTEAVIYFDPPV